MDNLADYSLLHDPDMKEIFDSFLVETRELLEKLDLDLVELENRPEDTDLLNEIFRSFHTIKGTSGFLGLVKLQALTHHGEDILNKLRKGEATVNQEIMDGILEGYDAIKELIDIIEENKNEDFESEAIIQKLKTILSTMDGGGSAELPADEASVYDDLPKVEDFQDPEPVPSADKQEIKEPVEAAEPEFKEPEEELKAESIAPAPQPETKHEVVEIPPPVNLVTESGAEPKVSPKAQRAVEQGKKAGAKKGENNIRVDVERLDDLLNFVQELVLGRNRLSQLSVEMSMEHEGTDLARDLADTTRQIDLMTTELQLAVMKTRMIKIGKVFNRFPRLIRDLSREMGKEIQLNIKGEETELDKTLIEEINDPLVHLVRNSVDHGVELPDVREEIGKPRKGIVTLSAEHEGNFIIIKIEDDGKGIDPDVIKNKAVSKGLITKERAAEMSNQEAYNLIFAPGFSTAEKVTNVSGRGVGMDVVKTNVTKLRGIINIESELGKGTTMVIKLPLTLAIIHGLLVNISEETIVIPLNSVIEVVRINKNEIYSVNQTECIKLRDTVHPLINISSLLYSSNIDGENEEDWQYIVIVGIAEKRFGLKVDDLIGQEEVVIKSLGNYLGNIEGIAGSTIMGDGKVVMIADIAELVHKLADVN